MKIEIKSWINGAVLFSHDCENNTIKTTLELGVSLGISFNNAELNDAKLNYAKLNYAELNGAELNNAKLNDAKLNYAELNDAELNGAELNGAELNGAELNGAELNNAILDFSCLPLHCGGTGIVGDDRLFAQLLFHLTRQNWNNCSGGVREALAHITQCAAVDLFCEYRSDVTRLEDK